MASPAPAVKAVSACGTRDFITMLLHISDSPSPPKRMLITETKGMFTVPNSRFSKKNTTMSIVMSRMSGMGFLFMIRGESGISVF